MQSFLDLREGDYVVHLAHGIGRYLGLKEIHRQGQSEEHLEIEFHAGTRIFVPATRIDLVQKYVGGKKSRPQLAKIGGRLWQQQKKAAEAAVQDLAAELLEVQAERAARPGIVFSADTEWQREFDAAFPYDETLDQLSAIDDIKSDLRSPRPMDRLLCGDVGYGKTELAMRAAFQAVDNGYQVALLAPTTILVEQHYNSFKQRMAEFPFQITKLSRFASARDQRDSIRRLREGSVDIVIGTHRLASRDVEFQNLGLLIIDEEQRFGVEIKERLKRLRSTVNVLTLSATPIPRTLHMSLTGMRDISNLETPPAERLPVETRVVRWSDSLIRSAVLRELDRGGQIFFVHNRVQDIHNVAAKLQRIVPEARLGIGHGQMDEHELERVMVDFISHKFDMLLATTIVESGLDIPNANTIFIDEAHRYGLAELHQLRGRVGRENRRAYCSLLIHERGSINPSAARRLQAIQEFSEMGAGFAIAMRDLEIRGAGNILGPHQSGHIATVGYELYCQLLEAAVRRLKRMPPQARPEVAVDLPGDIYLPRDYVSDLRAKVDLYRRINQVDSYTAVEQLREEMRDRFGALPDPVLRLLTRAELKLDAACWSVTKVRWEAPFLLFTYRDSQRARQLGKLRGSRLRFVGHAELCCQLANDASSELLETTAKSLLQAT
ncbi:MAG: transcription-repair coupling factor [Planctomycetota bacterium]|nr:transcription-repair coupling factor [Planctomycetota bacterium]